MDSNTTSTEDWREGLTMSNRMLRLLNSNVPNVPHDVSLIVGMNEEKITCHKIFLIASSHVFESMIINESVNSEDNETEISLPDQDPESVRKLLRYIYTGEKQMPSELSASSILSMIHCAIELAFPEVIDFCWSNMQDTYGVKMAVTIYQAVKKCNAYKWICRKISTYIVQNFYEVMVAGDFLEFEPRNLRGFLALDNLPIFSEVELFKHVVSWGEHQMKLKGLDETSRNLREVLEPVIKHVRFPTMTVEQFHRFVYPRHILKDEETIQLLFGWLSQPHKNIAKFKRVPRTCRNDIMVSFCEDNHSASVTYKREALLEDSFHISGNLGFFLLRGLIFAVEEPASDKNTEELGEMTITLSTAGSDIGAAESLVDDTFIPRQMSPNKCIINFHPPLKLACELTYNITYTSRENRLYSFTDPVEEQTFQSSNVGHATIKNLHKRGCLIAIIFTFVE